MAAITTSTFTFLKEALILPTRNPKLFTPVFLLLAVAAFLVPLINVLFVQPLTDDMASLLIEIKNTGPSSAEYARLLEEIKYDAGEIVLITIALLLVTLALSFVKQIVAFFAASTTYSGDCYSLLELLRQVIMKGNHLKGPSITIAVITVLDLACMALLAALLSTVTRGRHSAALISVQGLLFLLAFLAFLYFTVVALVGVAVSVVLVDEGCRGVGALRQAWRVMTRVSRKEGFMLVLVTLLLPTVLSPLYGLALVYKKKNMAMGLCLLSVYALLSGAVQLFYFAAATVYYYQAMESKEVMPCDYAKIPSGEATV